MFSLKSMFFLREYKKNKLCLKPALLIEICYLNKFFANLRTITVAIDTKNIAATALINSANAQNITPKTTISINKVIIITLLL